MTSLSAKARRLLNREAARADAAHTSQAWQEELSQWEPESGDSSDEDDQDSVHYSDDEDKGPSASKPTKRKKKGLYHSVRVLFLSWDLTRRTEVSEAVDWLKSIFQREFRFAVHHVRLPGEEGVYKPDGFLMEYLLRNNLLSNSDRRNGNDLVILVYEGESRVKNFNGKKSLWLTQPGGKMEMPFDWLEKRLAYAPYNSLIVMPCEYMPGEVLDKQEGVNMVLSARGLFSTSTKGPGNEFKQKQTEAALKPLPEEDQRSVPSSEAKPWPLEFVERICYWLKKALLQDEKPLSVGDLHDQLLQPDNDGRYQGLAFCDYILGKKDCDGATTKDMIYFEPLGDVERDGGWTVLGDGDGELDSVDASAPPKEEDPDLLLVSDRTKGKPHAT
ncbi:hypothetical protein QBC44DRAFT_311361 [Cladorrhinum sp. PSN332]|nr:hypothetical protein QBC44DRAFT_311361 [Cladorrhinum sp. PSN332]